MELQSSAIINREERQRKINALNMLEDQERVLRLRLENEQTAIRYEPPLFSVCLLLPGIPRELCDAIIRMLPAKILPQLQLISKQWYQLLRYIIMKRSFKYWVRKKVLVYKIQTTT